MEFFYLLLAGFLVLLTKYKIKRLIEKEALNMTQINSREKILFVAGKLFAEKGFYGVGIREITAAAEVNSSAISYYFGGKYGLYCAVIENVASMLTSVFDKKDTQKLLPCETIRLYVETVQKLHCRYPYFVRLLYHELLMPTDVMNNFATEKLLPVVDILRCALKRGKDSGLFLVDLDIDKAIIMLAGAINFYYLARPIHQSIIKQDEVFADTYIDTVLTVFLQGISRSEKNEKI